MNDFFDFAFNYLISKDEGSGFTDDPVDSGGATKAGITKRWYEVFMNCQISLDDFKNLSMDAIKSFYQAAYWQQLKCDKFTDRNVATAIFDSAVLYGIPTVGLMVQRAAISCGVPLDTDGILGQESVNAVNSISVGTFLNSFCAQVLGHIQYLVGMYPKNKKFQEGWINRANRLLTLPSL